MGPDQAPFNKYLSKARGIIEIEMSFGRTKVRQRAIFLRTLPLNQLAVPKMVGTCTMLQDINQGVENIRDDSVLEPTRRPRHVAEGMRSASREELAAANSAETQCATRA